MPAQVQPLAALAGYGLVRSPYDNICERLVLAERHYQGRGVFVPGCRGLPFDLLLRGAALTIRDLDTKRRLMLEALENLENDDGRQMPASAWKLVQEAIAIAKVQ